MKAEEIVSLAKKLPGFYAYRPTMKDGEILIEELMFRLYDDETSCEYNLSLMLEDGNIASYFIDARYSDGSIAEIDENDEDFKEILSHKKKIVDILSGKYNNAK